MTRTRRWSSISRSLPLSVALTAGLALGAAPSAHATSRARRGASVLAVGQGNGHMLLVKPNGFVSAWGDNAAGELGDNPSIAHKTPWQSSIADLTEVAAGDSFSVGVDQNSNVLTWGRNGGCQLGNGVTNDSAQPQQIAFGARTVGAGKAHAFYLTALGEFVAWGSNTSGETGQPPSANKAPLCTPVAMPRSGATWLAAAAGDGFSVGLATDGTIWTWGSNTSGQLGIGSTPTQPWVPRQVTASNRWVAIAAGAAHVVAINDKGELWGWGSNDQGQLAAATSTAKFTAPHKLTTAGPFKAVAAGNHHTLALMANGTLWGVGDNNSGQLGIGNNTSQTALTQSSGKTSDWQYIKAGGDSSAAIKADGTLFAWGNNAKAQLGTNNTTSKNAPTSLLTSVKPGFVAAYTEIRSNGTMREWYSTGAPVAIPGSTNSLWIDVARGSNGHWLAVRSDGSLWSWGNNSEGELGNGVEEATVQPLPARVGTDNKWVAVQASLTTSFGLKADGTLWAWGENDSNGKLGTGDTSPRYVPSQIGTSVLWSAFAADQANGYAISSKGDLYGWGDNQSGWVGDGNYGDGTDVTAPKLIGASASSGWRDVAEGAIALDQYGVVFRWGGTGVSDGTAVPHGFETYSVQLAPYALLRVWGEVEGAPTLADDTTPIDLAVTTGGRGVFEGPTQLTTRGKVQALHAGSVPTVIDSQIY